MFFQSIYQMMSAGTDLNINIRRTDGKLSVAVMPRRTTLKDEAGQAIVPLILNGTPMELDGQFLQIITTPLQKAQGILTNLETFEQQARLTATQGKATGTANDKKTKEAREKQEKMEKLLKRAEEAFTAGKYSEATTCFRQAKVLADTDRQKQIEARIQEVQKESSQGCLFPETDTQPLPQQPPANGTANGNRPDGQMRMFTSQPPQQPVQQAIPQTVQQPVPRPQIVQPQPVPQYYPGTRSQLLKGKSADEAEAAVAKREKELTHALDGARLGVETLHNRLLGLQGEMKQIAATVGELQEQQKKIESPEQLPEIIKQQQEDNLNTERSLSAIEVRLLQQAKNKVTAELIAKELAEKQLIAERWAKLNKLIGSADGAKFKVIAQSYTLNLLLLHANKHLSYLSKRYKLQQVPGTLALQVIDCDMCDEIRTVYSLSGGESFLISLALALGLSSLSSNNLKVESLFIDEGFGSLDADSLRTAMEALEQLQMQGRKIGVISHVQEMSERISVQVQVHKKVNGKSVLTVVG